MAPAARSRSRSQLVMALVAAVLITVWLPSAAQANDAQITGERQVTGRVIELTIATPAFVAPTKVDVNLPAGYDAEPSRRWPVT
jgi:hypothetical protein